MASKASSSSSKKMKMVKNQEGKTTVVANFSNDIIENIISFLPLKKAFICGTLSKSFLNSWKLSRDLLFDVDFRRLANRADIFNIIQFVMDNHGGPVIRTLRVTLDPSGKENQVFDWIRKAVEKGIHELDLDFSSGNSRFLFPSDLLHGARLQVLKACYCNLDSLNPMDGLRYLKTIIVEDVLTPRDLLDAIFSNCLLLENFEMTNSHSEQNLVIKAGKLKNFKSLKVLRCSNILNMNIDAPVLQEFHYIGKICRIVSKCEMAKIEEVVFLFSPSRSIELIPGVEDFIIALRRAKTLSISSTIVERLCAKFSQWRYKEFYFCFENLKELHLCLGGSTGNSFIQSTNLNPYDIACFLSKSPSIEKLTVDFGIFPLESGPYWELVAKKDFDDYVTNFKFLKSVCLMNFKFFTLEMDLAAFILASAVVLEDCVVVKAKRLSGTKENELEFVRWCASENFKTTIYKHNEYKSY